MIHIDTSFLVRALVARTPQDRQLRTWLDADEVLAISALAWTEFLCGPLDPSDAHAAAAILGEPVAITALHAGRAAVLFNASGRRRGTLVDCLIAACAIEDGASLATANPRDFARLPGLQLA